MNLSLIYAFKHIQNDFLDESTFTMKLLSSQLYHVAYSE